MTQSNIARLIVFQFSFSNPKAVPAGIPWMGAETKTENVERKAHATGVQMIDPNQAPETFIGNLPAELMGSNYELVDAFAQTRPGGQRGSYTSVRFTFARKEFVESSSEFLGIKDRCLKIFNEMCSNAYWRIRAYRNPFFENEKPVDGMCAISMNFEVRTPILRPDGKPVVAWKKDAAGERIGEGPVPIEPKNILAFDGSSFIVGQAVFEEEPVVPAQA